MIRACTKSRIRLSRSCLLGYQPRRWYSAQSPTASGTGDKEYGPEQRKQDLEYCISVVRERDSDGFYCGLLMPSEAQKAYFVLRAFNAEIASIKNDHYARVKENRQDRSNNYALQLRLHWWKHAIGQIFGDDLKSPDPVLASMATSCWTSPVIRALNVTNKDVKFTRRFLDRLIEAREVDMEVEQFATLDDTKRYAEQSVSSLLYLSLEILGVREDAADEVASFAGVGIGLTTALRGTPIRLMQGESSIPSNLLSPNFPYDELRAKLAEQENHRFTDEFLQQWQEAVQQMALTASIHLAEARDKQGQVPKSGRSALLPVIPSLHYLSRLEKAKFNVLDPTLMEPDKFRMMLMLCRTWLTGIF